MQRLYRDLQDNGPTYMAKKTGISYSFMYSIYKDRAPERVNPTKLEELYEYYKVPKDAFFISNQKKWERPTQSILGNIFRQKRLEKFLSIDDVAKMVRGDSRAIHRIESGDTLPNFNSYYITKFLEIYDFTEEEKQTIQWSIVILRDLVNIYKQNDIEKKD